MPGAAGERLRGPPHDFRLEDLAPVDHRTAARDEEETAVELGEGLVADFEGDFGNPGVGFEEELPGGLNAAAVNIVGQRNVYNAVFAYIFERACFVAGNFQRKHV